MKKQQLKDAVINCILYGVSVILFLVILFAAISAAHANIPERSVVETHDAKIIRAYEKLLHEVWLDKPSYVEDALMEGDAFIELDELLDGEWDDYPELLTPKSRMCDGNVVHTKLKLSK